MNSSNRVPESDLDLETDQEDETNSYFNELDDLELESHNQESNAQKIRSKNKNKRIIKGKIEMQLEKIRQKRELEYLYDDYI
ncbi:hypothetical protein [Psychromonas sp.]|uniref:hypothetical protein n=1 Tax=Psychromonas sp. TaxID=1884585 RepID=UPI003569423A